MRGGRVKIEFLAQQLTQQGHKLYYLYELGLSRHVNLFGPSVGPKYYLLSFFLKSSSSFTLLMQKFQFVFSFLLLYFLTFFFLCSFFLIF